MEDIITYHISNYINDNDFIYSFSLIFNKKQFIERRKSILNKFYSKKLIENFSDDPTFDYEYLLHHNYKEDVIEIFKEYSSNLLFNTNFKYIVYDNYIAPSKIIHKKTIITKYCHLFKKEYLHRQPSRILKYEVCSIYRVTPLIKNIIKKNRNIAALIY